jgi:hypothetical protein
MIEALTEFTVSGSLARWTRGRRIDPALSRDLSHSGTPWLTQRSWYGREGCPYRKSNPDVLMVQTSEVWGGHDNANGLHSTRAERKPTTN